MPTKAIPCIFALVLLLTIPTLPLPDAEELRKRDYRETTGFRSALDGPGVPEKTSKKVSVGSEACLVSVTNPLRQKIVGHVIIQHP